MTLKVTVAGKDIASNTLEVRSNTRLRIAKLLIKSHFIGKIGARKLNRIFTVLKSFKIFTEPIDGVPRTSGSWCYTRLLGESNYVLCSANYECELDFPCY